MHRREDVIYNEADAHIKDFEQEIAQMRQNLAAYGNTDIEDEFFGSSAEDFLAWKKSRAAVSVEPEAFEEHTYKRSQRAQQSKRQLRPVWKGVLLTMVLLLCGFGVIRMSASQPAMQPSEQQVEQNVIQKVEQQPGQSMTQPAATTVAPQTTVASQTTVAPQTTVIAEKVTKPNNELVIVGASTEKENEKDPAGSMVAIGEKIIVLDAGHGGNDHGSVYGGVSEKDVDLQITLQLGETLEDMGYEVLYTREDDEYFSLGKRAKFANDNKADIFVSIHCNAFEDASVYGMDVYHNKVETADFLAEQVFNSLADKLDTRARSYSYGSYQVIRQSKMPGILIEIGFLSNDAERKKLCDEEYQAAAIEAISEAVHEYFVALDPESNQDAPEDAASNEE